MKQKNKKIIYSFSHLLLFGVVILLVTSLKSPMLPASPTPGPHIETESVPPTSAATRSNHHPSTQLASVHQAKKSDLPSLSPKADIIKESIQHEILYRMFVTPNDPGYTNNWALTKINASNAWNVAVGNGQTIVAVIDTGFGLAHEDLVNQWYINGHEYGLTKLGDRCWSGSTQEKSANNCDDDNNGYVDDWRGWSFVNSDNNPQTGRQNSSGAGVSHATAVSGIIGATGNNGIGIASLNWDTKIMPLQVLDDDGNGYTSSVVAAVYYAVDNGAQVINLSLGAYINDPAIKVAVNYATEHDVVIVAAAGNCGSGTAGTECTGVPTGTIAYPAAYPDVIAVGATTTSDQRASFSSYGAALDVSAPGYNTSATTAWSVNNQTSLYVTGLYGTSFASPMVASLASLIKAIRPTASVNDVTAIIDATAQKPAAMNGIPYSTQLGHGIIDAGTAMTIATALNNTSNIPALLQAGSYRSEHTTYTNATMSSGCQTTVGNACSIQLLESSSGYKRFLPYSIIPASGAVGWSWPSEMLSGSSWEIRAISGNNVSNTPYLLFKKG